jgi:DUF917 family protein
MAEKEIGIDGETARAIILGGAILGGGGGGWIEEGLEMARLALQKKFSRVLPLTAMSPESLLLTVSAVGAPSAGRGAAQPEDFVRSVDFFIRETGLKIEGLISSEVGALAATNGWLQSAALNIPVIDAPANGRAHPLGLMGSMGLHRKKGYVSRQAVVGGMPGDGSRVEELYSGNLREAAKLVREASVKAGGMVAVARNAVPASYVRKNGAPGALGMAIDAGKIFLAAIESSPEKAINQVLNFFGGSFMIRAKVREVLLRRMGGLDVGRVEITCASTPYELTFWNEYMTLESRGRRLATFPDLMMTFDAETGQPLISAQLEEKKEVFVISAPARRLILGAGVKDARLLREIEEATGKEIVRFLRKYCRREREVRCDKLYN